ncbi:MAG: putative septum site-determining protein MinC [Thermosynechococcus sp.]|uniref:septum site-determining protein MinC n=1 Tax=Thermosynechococcus sp. TaxID=2814275 RepID=UPI0021FA0BC4|nr:septum site-determining protein MinC [Thermosynechococcus sp.]BCX11320.1 MAG: putative septum site-determining protein MinC [Thermosynechococcus sp.]
MSEAESTPVEEPVSESTAGIEAIPEVEQNTALVSGLTLEHSEGRYRLTLPSDLDWIDLWPQVQLYLIGQEHLWSETLPVDCVCGQRLLDQSQLQQLAEALSEHQLRLDKIITQRRQTAIAAATLGYSVQQGELPPLLAKEIDGNPEPTANPLYLKTTLRSGIEIHHDASVIIVGDVNAGASIIAAGDIIVWGRLRGVAHAGAKGHLGARIMTLEMAATQLRIADLVARTPDPPRPPYPEVAYATDQGIQIAPAYSWGRVFAVSEAP